MKPKMTLLGRIRLAAHRPKPEERSPEIDGDKLMQKLPRLVHFQSVPKGIDFAKVMMCPPCVGEKIVLDPEGREKPLRFEVTDVEHWFPIPDNPDGFDPEEVITFCTIRRIPIETDEEGES